MIAVLKFFTDCQSNEVNDIKRENDIEKQTAQQQQNKEDGHMIYKNMTKDQVLYVIKICLRYTIYKHITGHSFTSPFLIVHVNKENSARYSFLLSTKTHDVFISCTYNSLKLGYECKFAHKTAVTEFSRPFSKEKNDMITF